MSLPGLQKVQGKGTDTYFITSEDAHRNPHKTQKTAVVENKDAPKDETKTAFFDIRGAGNWIEGIRSDLNRRFGNVRIKRTSKEEPEDDEEPFTAFSKGLQQVHPMNIMNDQVKNRLKSQAKANSGKIAGIIVEAGLYCAAFHHCKQGLKRITRDRKYSGPTVRYVSDVMMPNGLYGPVFGFLIRLALPF